MMVKLVSSLVAMTALLSQAAALPRVHPEVHRALREQGSVNLMVTMKRSTDEAIKSPKEAVYNTRGDKISALVGRLASLVDSSQSELENVLAQESTKGLYTSTQTFWITNQRLIRGASWELVEKLSSMVSVSDIQEEYVVAVPEIRVEASAPPAVDERAWGISRVRAPEVWAKGNTGEGVIVAVVDTGALITHEAFRSNFIGDYGWFDPEAKLATPYDNNGHGTHCLGTIAGTNGIGVAPGAKWMACKSCRTRECSQADILACFEFVTCPTDTNGENRDCSKAPHVASNSWGGDPARVVYQPAVKVWREAGIIPVFAAGNSGYLGCSTTNSPGNFDNVIAVGGTDVENVLYFNSSRGPSGLTGEVKPELVAPGVAVFSSYIGNNARYARATGTSMACPHVAGAVTLMASAKPGLTYDEARAALIAGAVTDVLKPEGATCGGLVDNVYPNNHFGHGLLDIVKSLEALSGDDNCPDA